MGLDTMIAAHWAADEKEIPVMPNQPAPNLMSWASEIDEGAILQAARTARLPFVAGHVALMPDAHVGIGATVGSVIPTEGAIIPAAVGVDIGCGMVATETTLTAADLPDDLARLMPIVERRIPAGVGKGHDDPAVDRTLADLGLPYTSLTPKQETKVAAQFGTLGSGNHFVEVCLDERERVWTVLHSGSRGIGNQLATKHIAGARALMRRLAIGLEDPDLAYFTQSTPEFTAYIEDMLWAQRYAMASRARMDRVLVDALFRVVGTGSRVRTINCHHNYSERETHGGKDLWITRKGAIKAASGDEGVIPGVDGDAVLHRARGRQPGVVQLLLPRGGAADVARAGQAGAVGALADRGDARPHLELRPGRRSGGRAPGGVQADRPGDGRPA